MIAENEIYSSRILEAPVRRVYQAFAQPQHLRNWWGPEGFTNTIHEFDLRPEGKWVLTMHGPEKGNYENESVFTDVQPEKLVAWKRLSQPLFNMEVHFKKIDEKNTEIAFRMIFKSVSECEKIKSFAVPKNEENFDRLEKELSFVII
ncbi:SRPBCC family protein [Flavobacterium sp. NRK F7]|uniref:SRPBCC family protein n=1 Tax=Flavobacterium sp. NRK F7 TaxID=2954930 RepID=UPI002090C59C|nr:SRPBCC family protein [Flavobacterium sp. NRK F7]MCO6161587.1 SRPBCC family protein [Flavobacterium sp. NRK F7]